MIDYNIIVPGVVTPLAMLASAWLGLRNKIKAERMVAAEHDLQSCMRRVEKLETENVTIRELLRVCEEGRLSLLETLASRSTP